MKDRFKFRAKLKGMDKWVYGAYLKMLPYQPYPVGGTKPLETEYKHLIITEGSADWGMPRGIAAYEVIPETVGQCTGLKDKNGKLIYEGDILKENWHIYKLEWGNGAYIIKDIKRGTSYMFTSGLCIEKSEVIGNIYQDKELLNEI